MKFSLALTLSLAGVALAHNRLKSPPSRNGNKAATIKPCPQAADSYVAYTVKPGETIDASWTVNHAKDHWLVIEKTEDLLEASENKVAMIHPAETGSITAPTEPGTYVLQYGWGGYRNCVDLEVTAPTVVESTCAATGENTECHKLHGLQSECVSSECVCMSGYTMTDAKICESDVPLDVDCAFFCIDALANCLGDASIYDDMDDCLAKCATFPIGELNAPKGNSLNCRFWHLHVEQDATKHCDHASYSGLDEDHCAGGDYKHGVAVKIGADLPATSQTLNELKGYLAKALGEIGVEDSAIVVSESAEGEFVAIVHAFSAAEVKTITSSAAKLQTGLDTASGGVVKTSAALAHEHDGPSSGKDAGTGSDDLGAAAMVTPGAIVALCLVVAQCLFL